MSSSTTSSFTEADDYQANLREIMAEFVVTSPQPFTARTTRITLHHLHLLRARETLPRIAYIALPPELVFISFSSDPALPLFWRGLTLEPGEIMLHSRGERLHQRILGASCWGLISLPPATLATFGEVVIGRAVAPPVSGQILRPSARDRRHLLRVHTEAAHLAENRPQVLGHPEVVRAMEQELAEVLVTCLTACEVRTESNSVRRTATIMHAFEDLLTTGLHQSLLLPEICAAIGVSERTLRGCCAVVLSVSPLRYIQLRRLKRVRAAILRADPKKARVADLASYGGFTQPGRFAVLYRAAFGETPSTTLRRAGGNSPIFL